MSRTAQRWQEEQERSEVRWKERESKKIETLAAVLQGARIFQPGKNLEKTRQFSSL